jgi:serine/threonine protein kinase
VNPYFAVKELRSTQFERFRDEVRALERFSGERSHPHLVRLLMTFEQESTFYLVFPWADGNVVDLWQRKPLAPSSKRDTKWLLGQCVGLTQGLYKIHNHPSWKLFLERRNIDTSEDNFMGTHCDIKPENILWFEKEDKLVITDFGLTQIHSPGTVSDVPRAQMVGCSRTYRPPEVDLLTSWSQKYDLWCMGCLFLEMISCFLLDYQETRKTFSMLRLEEDKGSIKEDKFFNMFRKIGEPETPVARVKTSVKDVSFAWYDLPSLIQIADLSSGSHVCAD